VVELEDLVMREKKGEFSLRKYGLGTLSRRQEKARAGYLTGGSGRTINGSWKGSCVEGKLEGEPLAMQQMGS